MIGSPRYVLYNDNNIDLILYQIQGLVQTAQVQQLDQEDHHRYQNSLVTILAAEKEITKLIQEIESAIAEHRSKGDILKQQGAESRQRQGLNLDSDNNDDDLAKEKGKQREMSITPSEEGESDSEDGDIPKTPAGEEYINKRRALQQRLRESRIVLHRVKFLQGDLYHILGAAQSTQEDEAYAVAETVRRNLLKSKPGAYSAVAIVNAFAATEEDALRGMAQLDADVTKQGIDKDSLMIPVPLLEAGGIRSREHVRSSPYIFA